MKEIKTTRTIEEVTGYEAKDGTIFKSKEECSKYELTCECVIMSDYKKLVFAHATEYSLNDCGSDDCEIQFVKINNEHEREILNKALKFYYTGAITVTSDYIGKIILVYKDGYDNTLTGGWTTIDKIVENIMVNYNAIINEEN